MHAASEEIQCEGSATRPQDFTRNFTFRPLEPFLAQMLLVHLSVTDPGFPIGERQPLRGSTTYYLTNFPRNCMKMKTFLRRGGGDTSLAPLDPPLFCKTYYIPSLFILKTSSRVHKNQKKGDQGGMATYNGNYDITDLSPYLDEAVTNFLKGLLKVIL